MNKPARIVVVGSTNMDLVITSPRIPVPGETILGEEFFTIPGGKGANQAVAACRLGAKVEMIGCVGEDGFGRQLKRILEQENIGTKHLHVLPDVSTGVALITVSREGENTIVLSSGANQRLLPEHIRSSEGVIQQADVLLVQLEIPLETVAEAVRIANKHQVKVILNPAPARQLPPELLTMADILTPNETESKILAGLNADSVIEKEELIHKLRELGVPQVIITCGENGVVYNTESQIHTMEAFKVKAVDTTAAGDAFNGALGTAIAEGLSLVEAINFAQKSAAYAVTKFGAHPSLPYRDEIK